MNMHIEHSQVKYDAYQNHQVFELIDHMMDYYDGISDTSFSFIPNGTLTFGNYATYVYMSIRSTLGSIKMLLKEGHITDAFVLIRKLFDTVLVEIYLNVVREDQFDWMTNIVVKDVDEWLKKRSLDSQNGKDTERTERIEIDKRPVPIIRLGDVSEEEQVALGQSCSCKQLQEHTAEL